MRISQAAFDLIVAEEVSSEAVYRKKYTRPEWPGESSGVTVGIGYDVGYHSEDEVRADWSGLLPAAMVEALADCCGVRGAAAKALTAKVKSKISVPWEAAIAVFRNVSIPKWEATVAAAVPNIDKLSSDCFGALVSLAYNRGASFGLSGARYAEMRAIKSHMKAGKLYAIPAEIRAMKRLWPNTPGLQKRRDKEAALFEKGLNVAPAPIPPPPDIPAPIPQPMPAPAPSWIGALVNFFLAIFKRSAS